MNKSIATIDAPQFINLQPLDINPLMSKCEIKVLYVGGNRNRSYISKETATEMAKTLRGAPIVGYYKTEKEDFVDHGQRVILDDEGIKFECLTVPYGFVSPNADVWFQNFEDTDEFGNVEIREYLMTTGYLWTGQFEECKSAVEGQGKPQSMELDESTLKGNWATDKKTDIEFFIINDAIFSKLCILGEDVEPCFEGASVSAPQVSATFSLDEGFKNTLFSMMKDLESAIKGGQQMEVEKDFVETTEPVAEVVEEVVEATEASAEVVEETPVEEVVVEEAAEPAEEVVEEVVETNTETEVEFAASKKDKKDEEEEPSSEESDDPKDEEETSNEENNEEEDEDEKKKKYALLETQFTELKTSYDALLDEVTSLRSFKLEVEAAEKDKLINSFYMLSDEDKKEVIENKSSYTLEQIESKLSVICVRKKVNFNLNEETAQEQSAPAIVYTMDNNEECVPAWITAVKNNQKK
jgi:hypothetical protein